jgi:hypothetical protein
MLLDVAYFGTCSNNCSLILALSRDWYLNTYVASLLHLIFLMMQRSLYNMKRNVLPLGELMSLMILFLTKRSLMSL